MDVESALHEPRDRFQVCRHAAKRRIAMRGRVGRGSLQRVDDRGGNRSVGVSDTEVVEWYPASARVRLEAVELREDIERQRIKRFAQPSDAERRAGPGERKLSRYRESRSSTIRRPIATGVATPRSRSSASYRLSTTSRGHRKCHPAQ